MKLKNKAVLITGSSRGIGKATALAFIKAGSKVILTYNTNKKEGEATLKECKKSGEAHLVHFDTLDDIDFPEYT